MDEEAFKIYVEQLRDGHTENIEETLPPDFLDVQEKELRFEKPIELIGDAYLAEDMLVLNFNFATEVQIPCSICNALVTKEIKGLGMYHAEPMAEIKSGIFSFKNVLRELILLEIPQFAECEGGCPKRKEIDKYLKKNSEEDDEGYHPFADFEWDKTKTKL